MLHLQEDNIIPKLKEFNFGTNSMQGLQPGASIDQHVHQYCTPELINLGILFTNVGSMYYG